MNYKKGVTESTTAAASKGKKISKGLVKFYLKNPKLTIHKVKEKLKEEQEAQHEDVAGR